jgi:hypothetical protein
MAKHVAQDDAAALRHRQPHEGPEAGRHDLAILDGVPYGRDHVQILVRMLGLLARPSAQEVQSRMVGDAKQPTLRIGDRPCRRRRLHHLQHGFLNHVLAIDDGAGHPRAVAVQPRPELAQKLFHGLLWRRGLRVASCACRQG